MNETLFKAIKRRRVSEVRAALAVARTQLDDMDFLQAKVWFPAALEDMNAYCLAWPKRPAHMNDHGIKLRFLARRAALDPGHAPELASAAG